MSLFEENKVPDSNVKGPDLSPKLNPADAPGAGMYIPWMDTPVVAGNMQAKPLFGEAVAGVPITREVLLLIDADSLVYQAAHIGSRNQASLGITDNGLECVLDEQKTIMESRIAQIREGALAHLEPKGIGISGVKLLVTPHAGYRQRHGLKPNYRYQLVQDYNKEEASLYEEANLLRAEDEQLVFTPLPGYKASRAKAARPANVTELLEWVLGGEMDVIPSDGSEADDYAYALKTRNPEHILVAALDKDVLYGTPSGSLGHFNFGRNEMVYVSEDEAKLFVYRQCMMGDSTDGIPGIYRCGVVRAAEALPEWLGEEASWEKVMEKFTSESYSEQYAILMMRLVSLAQLDDSFTVRLWSPNWN